jgi:adenylate cyclase
MSRASTGNGADAERARANLGRYFAPNLVDLLAESDEPLGPVRRRQVAVLFADIVGFTRMARRWTPEAVVGMLREFHQRMAAQIFACGGTIEKYIGDEIFAVFGLPTASPHDASSALRCAALMLKDSMPGTRSAPAGELPLRSASASTTAGGAGRRRHRAQPRLHRDRRHGQHRKPPAGLTAELKTPLVVADAILKQIGDGQLPLPCRTRANASCVAAAAPSESGRAPNNRKRRQ